MAKKIGKNGTRHWVWQRASAVLLIPLTLWIIFAGNQYIYSDYLVAREWVSRPITSLLGLLSFLILVIHGYLGLVAIIEDYTKGAVKRALSFLAVFITAIIGMSASLIFVNFLIN